jgi:hypothetical protein
MQPVHAILGRKKILLGLKIFIFGEREAWKTIEHWCLRQNLSIDVFFVEIGGGRFLVKLSHFPLIKEPPKTAVLGELLTFNGSFQSFLILISCNSSNDVIWATCDDLRLSGSV